MNISSNASTDNLIAYFYRFRMAKKCSFADVRLYFSEVNPHKLKAKLEEMVDQGLLLKHGESTYQAVNNLTDYDRIKASFNSEIPLTVEQLSRALTISDKNVKECLDTLLQEGFIERCPFLGSNFWLKFDYMTYYKLQEL